MDYAPILKAALEDVFRLWPLLLVPVFLAIANTRRMKGWIGEWMVRTAARLLLDAQVYRPFHNVTLATPDGTTQIDHVFVSPYGIFVVETKNRTGWIFGSENDAHWTQKIYRHSFQFQNPLRQNYKHTRAMVDLLGVPENRILSVIVFVGGSTFKTSMPQNVTHGARFVRHVKHFGKRVFTDRQVELLCRKIHAGQLSRSLRTRREHVRNVKAQHAPGGSARACPKCGSPMILRTVKRGQRAGRRFWGCSRYPACRGMRRAYLETA